MYVSGDTKSFHNRLHQFALNTGDLAQFHLEALNMPSGTFSLIQQSAILKEANLHANAVSAQPYGNSYFLLIPQISLTTFTIDDQIFNEGTVSCLDIEGLSVQETPAASPDVWTLTWSTRSRFDGSWSNNEPFTLGSGVAPTTSNIPGAVIDGTSIDEVVLVLSRVNAAGTGYYRSNVCLVDLNYY